MKAPYAVLFSTWAVPTQLCSQSGKYRWFDWSAVCSACQGAENAGRVTGQPYAVLFSTWALPTQPCSQSGKCRWFSCTTRSTITRLPSGASTSHSGVFRDGVLGVGVGTAHPCTGALAALCRIPAPRGPLRPLRGSLRSGNLIASRQAHSSRFFRRKLAHPTASVRPMV